MFKNNNNYYNNNDYINNEFDLFTDCKITLEDDESLTLYYEEHKKPYEREILSDTINKIFNFDETLKAILIKFEMGDVKNTINSNFSILWTSHQLNTQLICKSKSFLAFYQFETSEIIDKQGVYEIPLIGIISTTLNDSFWFSQISK